MKERHEMPFQPHTHTHTHTRLHKTHRPIVIKLGIETLMLRIHRQALCPCIDRRLVSSSLEGFISLFLLALCVYVCVCVCVCE